MSDFEADLLERSGDQRERVHVIGVPVARTHLRSDRRRAKSHAAANALLRLRTNVAEGPDGAGDLSSAHLLGNGREPLQIAADLVVPEGQFQPKRNPLAWPPLRPPRTPRRLRR